MELQHLTEIWKGIEMENKQQSEAQHMQKLDAYRFTVDNLRARVAELEAQLAAAPQAVQDAVPATNHSETPNSSTIIVPYGWKLVPDRATPDWVANLEALPDWREAVGECIKRFLAAAPAHPAEGVPQAITDEREAFVNWLHGTYHKSYSVIQAADLWFHKHVAALAWKARAALAATHPTQQGLEPIEQRQLAIGQAVERACKELPEGAEIQIYLERGAGTVHMTDWDGNEFDHFDEAHNDFACRINAATDGAIAAEKVAAQAKQGEQANG